MCRSIVLNVCLALGESPLPETHPMSEVRQEQERLDEELEKIWREKKTNPAQSQSYESTAVLEAITRLDNKGRQQHSGT